MKPIKGYLSVTLLFICCLHSIGQNIDYRDLVLGKNKLLYFPTDTTEPFTGIAIVKDSVGRIENEITIAQGEKTTFKSFEYSENGQKEIKDETNFIDGNKYIISTHYENGIKESEAIVKDGLYYITSWYNNGKMKNQFTVKNNENIGVNKGWYENGQQHYIKNYNIKNSVDVKYWYPNGKLKGEITIVIAAAKWF